MEKLTFGNYKEAEKYLKKLDSIDDFNAKVDGLDCSIPESVVKFTNQFRCLDTANSTSTVYEIKEYGGVYVAPGLLSTIDQINLAYFCVSSCLNPPNLTNLHSLLSEEEKVMLNDVWNRESSCLLDRNICKLPKSSTLSKIRWATLGYQYDWTNRKYPDNAVVDFPAAFGQFCSDLVPVCSNFTLKSEAGIVNLYPVGSIMGGHQDDAEKTYEHPVLSFSLGSSAIFLLGGTSREMQPLPIILRSGDVMIFGGPSRLCVHGVPRIFPNDLIPDLCVTKCHNFHHKIHHYYCDLFPRHFTVNIMDPLKRKLDSDEEILSEPKDFDDKRRKINPTSDIINCGVTTNEMANPCNDSVSFNGCTCGSVCDEDIMKLLNYFRFTRVNVNVRQVNP